MFRRTLRQVATIGIKRKNFSLLARSSFALNIRNNSTSSSHQQQKDTTQLSKKLLDEDEYDDYSEAKTVGQKVRWFGILFMRLGFLILGTYCVYLCGVELFPGRMGANNLFNHAFELVRYNAEVMAMTGDNMKGFGKDFGRTTEGRRNHIEHYKYTADDGSKRTRIRFNVQGSKSKVQVWAEVSDNMQAGELVYLICQDTRTGKVHTIVDNRSTLDSRPARPTNEVTSFFAYFKNSN